MAENKELVAEAAAKYDLATKGEIAIREERGITEKQLKVRVSPYCACRLATQCSRCPWADTSPSHVQLADTLEAKVLKAQKEQQELAIAAKLLASEHSQREMQMKLRRDELSGKKAELCRQQKLCEAYEKKIKKEEESLGKAEEERSASKARGVELEGEVLAMRGEKEKERQAVSSLQRERDALNRSLVKVCTRSLRRPAPTLSLSLRCIEDPAGRRTFNKMSLACAGWRDQSKAARPGPCAREGAQKPASGDWGVQGGGISHSETDLLARARG